MLSQLTNLPAATIAHRISGKWDPVTITFTELLHSENITADDSRPYPFSAYALENPST